MILDLRQSAMCGFYFERIEAVDALISLLEASARGGVSPADATATTKPEGHEVELGGGGSGGGPRLAVSCVEVDDACSLTDRQIRKVYDACFAPGATSPCTVLKVNGTVYKPGFGCLVM